MMGAPGEGRGAGSTPGSRTAWRQASLLPPQVESSQAFTWQSQLRHRWDEEKKHCFASKGHLVNTMVFPVVVYGFESWKVKKPEHRRIDAF